MDTNHLTHYQHKINIHFYLLLFVRDTRRVKRQKNINGKPLRKDGRSKNTRCSRTLSDHYDYQYIWLLRFSSGQAANIAYWVYSLLGSLFRHYHYIYNIILAMLMHGTGLWVFNRH